MNLLQNPTTSLLITLVIGYCSAVPLPQSNTGTPVGSAAWVGGPGNTAWSSTGGIPGNIPWNIGAAGNGGATGNAPGNTGTSGNIPWNTAGTGNLPWTGGTIGNTPWNTGTIGNWPSFPQGWNIGTGNQVPYYDPWNRWYYGAGNMFFPLGNTENGNNLNPGGPPANPSNPGTNQGNQPWSTGQYYPGFPFYYSNSQLPQFNGGLPVNGRSIDEETTAKRHQD